MGDVERVIQKESIILHRCLADRLFLSGDVRADEKQLATISIVRGDGSENKVECFEQTKLALARTIVRVFELFAALVVHSERLCGL